MLDILGTLPGGGIFVIMNAGYYLLEGNYKEAFKSIVFAIPGFDLMKTSSKLAVKGGRLSSAVAQVLSTLNTMDMLACVYYAASDFGNDMAYIIYKYGIEKAAFSEETWVELLSLTAHGIQLGHYSNPFMDTDLTPYFEKATNELNQNGGFGEGGSNSKLQEVFDIADKYNLSDDTFNNHILERHGSNSIYSNKSHFNIDFDIKGGIDSTLKGDNSLVKPNTGNRSGYIFEQTFKEPIGVSSKGESIFTLKVVIDDNGNVITAFPKNRRKLK